MHKEPSVRSRAVLGLGQTCAIAVGTTIGAGVFTYTSIAARFSGPALPLSYGLAAVPVAIALTPVAMMGAAIPTSGGSYKYPSRLLSPGLAFLGVWCYALGAFFGFFPLYALTCTDYLAAYFPALESAWSPGGAVTVKTLAAAAVLTLFYGLNYLGVSLAASIEALMVVILLLALGLYIAVGLPAVDPDHFKNILMQGWGGVLTGASLLTFAYLGSNAIIELGAEIRDPGETIPRAFAIAIPVVLLVYLGVALVTVGAADWQLVAGLTGEPPGEPEPLTLVARGFLGPGALFFFTVGGAVFAIVTSINASFLWGTKSLSVLCQDHLLPPWMGILHPRFGTPARLLTAIWLLSLLGLLLPIPRQVLATYATIGGLAVFVPVLLASMVLPSKCAEAYELSRFKLRGIWLYLAPGVGIALCLGAIVDLLMSQTTWLPMAGFLLWLVTGTGYYFVVRSRRAEVSGLLGRRDF